MAQLAQAYVDISARTEKLSLGLRTAEGAVKQSVARMQAEANTLGMTLQTSIIQPFHRLATRAAMVGAVGAAALGGIALQSVRLAAELEQAEIGFTTMLGSAERARAFLGQLEKFAERTPFSFSDLVTASQRFLAFGFSVGEVIPMLTAVGDATAAMGGGSEMINRIVLALGQMRAKGKVAGQEMLQLAEARIPAWQMVAERLGVSMAEAMKMGEQGAIDATTAITAILEGLTARYQGSMAGQSRRVLGLWSTLKDAIESIMRDLGKTIIETLDLPKRLAGLTRWLEENQTRFQAWGRMILQAAGDAATGFAQFLSALLGTDVTARGATGVIDQLVGAVRTLANWWRENAKALAGWLVFGIQLFVFAKLVTIFFAIIRAVQAWRTATIGLTIAQAALQALLLPGTWVRIVAILGAAALAWWAVERASSAAAEALEKAQREAVTAAETAAQGTTAPPAMPSEVVTPGVRLGTISGLAAGAGAGAAGGLSIAGAAEHMIGLIEMAVSSRRERVQRGIELATDVREKAKEELGRRQEAVRWERPESLTAALRQKAAAAAFAMPPELQSLRYEQAQSEDLRRLVELSQKQLAVLNYRLTQLDSLLTGGARA